MPTVSSSSGPAFLREAGGQRAGRHYREWIGASAAVMNAMDDLYQQVIRAPEIWRRDKSRWFASPRPRRSKAAAAL